MKFMIKRTAMQTLSEFIRIQKNTACGCRDFETKGNRCETDTYYRFLSVDIGFRYGI